MESAYASRRISHIATIDQALIYLTEGITTWMENVSHICELLRQKVCVNCSCALHTSYSASYMLQKSVLLGFILGDPLVFKCFSERGHIYLCFSINEIWFRHFLQNHTWFFELWWFPVYFYFIWTFFQPSLLCGFCYAITAKTTKNTD